jgi:hypothetical protein
LLRLEFVPSVFLVVEGLIRRHFYAPNVAERIKTPIRVRLRRITNPKHQNP